MIKNIDASIIINREIDDRYEDGERQYMGFKLVKFRGKPNKDRISLFLHPFDENNGILLPADLEGKPLSRINMEDFNPMNVNMSGGRPDFKDYDSESDEFIASFVDIISNDYKDTNKNYVDLYKFAEEEIVKSEELYKREKEIVNRRKRELKELKKTKLNRDKNNRILIHKKPYKVDEHGLIHIHRIVEDKKKG